MTSRGKGRSATRPFRTLCTDKVVRIGENPPVPLCAEERGLEAALPPSGSGGGHLVVASDGLADPDHPLFRLACAGMIMYLLMILSPSASVCG